MKCLKIIDLVLDPDGFFSRLSEERPHLTIPVIVVGIIGVVNIISSLLTGTFGYNPSLKAILFSSSPLLVLVLPFVLWILVSGILFLVGKRVSGKGDFVTTLRNAGYGFLPVAFFSIIFHVAMLTVMTALISDFAEGMLFFLVLFLFFIACLFWTGYILVFGVKYAHSLDNSQAFTAVVLMSILLVVVLCGIEFALLEYHGLTTDPMP